MANTIIGVGVLLVGLVLLAAGLAVTFATPRSHGGEPRGGGRAAFRRRQRRFHRQGIPAPVLNLGLRGSLAGAGAALILTTALGLVAKSWRASPTGDQLEALFGAFSISWRGYGVRHFDRAGGRSGHGNRIALTVRRFLKGNG